VAYLVRKGTKILVRKPTGEIVWHQYRKDCVLQPYQKLGERKTVQLQQGASSSPTSPHAVTR